MFEVPRLQKPLGEELPCEWYAVAVMRRCTIVGYRQEDASCSLAISGRSAACSLFLADQLLARYFWQIRDRGTVVL